jgi:hypothetical protein
VRRAESCNSPVKDRPIAPIVCVMITRRPLATIVVCTVVALWSLGVAASLRTLWAYENTPGPAAAAPGTWPAATGLPRPATRPAVVVALHPHCPCSRATLAELARLVARTPGGADVHALFVAPAGAGEDWIRTDLWRAAGVIPGVRVVRDDGTRARQFGMRVSGQTLVYDASGRLRFNGGLTGSRGHEGDNAGRAAAEAAVRGEPHAPSSFVFGCFLFDGDGAAAPTEDAA